MGLVVSILIVCVGVIEVLNCFEHFRNGIIDGAAQIYGNIRRGSSFLESAGKKLKLIRDNNSTTGEFKRFRLNAFGSLDETAGSSLEFSTNTTQSQDGNVTPFDQKTTVKKLDKADKIEIVKNRIERQQKSYQNERRNRIKSKSARSYSMPELEFTPEDIELSKIINELTAEPIAEVDLDFDEIEEIDLDGINKKFENLFESSEIDEPQKEAAKVISNDFASEIHPDSRGDLQIDKDFRREHFPGNEEGSFIIQNNQSILNGTKSNQIKNVNGVTKESSNVVESSEISVDSENSDLGCLATDERNENDIEENRRRHRSLISAFEEKSKTKFINPVKSLKIYGDAFDSLGTRNHGENLVKDAKPPSNSVNPVNFNTLISSHIDEKPPFVAANNIQTLGFSGEKTDAESIQKDKPNIKDNSVKGPKDPLEISNELYDVSFGNKSSGLDQFPLEQSLTGNLEIMELCCEAAEDEYVDDIFEEIYSNLETGSDVPISRGKNEKVQSDFKFDSEKEISEVGLKAPKRPSPLSLNQPALNDITAFADELVSFCYENAKDSFLKKPRKIEDESSQVIEDTLPDFKEFKCDETYNQHESLSKMNNDEMVVETVEDAKKQAPHGERKMENGDFDSDECRTNGKLVSSKFQKKEENFLENFPFNVGGLKNNQNIEKPIQIETSHESDLNEIHPFNRKEEIFIEDRIVEKGNQNASSCSEAKEKLSNPIKENNQCSLVSNEKSNGISIETEETFEEDLKKLSIKDKKEVAEDEYEEVEEDDDEGEEEEEEEEEEVEEEVEYIIEYEDETSEDSEKDADERVIKKVSDLPAVEIREPKEKDMEEGTPELVPDESHSSAPESKNDEKFKELDDNSASKAKNVFPSFGEIRTMGQDLDRKENSSENTENDRDERKTTKEELMVDRKSKGDHKVDMKKVENSGQDAGGEDKTLQEQKLKVSGSKDAEPSTPCWLIFSGEYTKAMSKDWHSGHFSCWQCDEALTGQRYVLREDHPYCIKCYESVFANVCEECNKVIGIDSKDLSYKDKHWHEACFLCNKCKVSLVDKQFGSKAEKIYCGNCYDVQFASRCDGCGEVFRAGTKKMEYKTRQWHEKCFCCCVCKTSIGTKSFIPREQEIYCAMCYEEKFATRCVKCNKIITSGGVTYKNEPWHRECFTCNKCSVSLAGQRFTSRDEKPYCADCFGELFAKRCTACTRPITGIGGTRFISFEERHWHNDCFVCAACKASLVGRGFITDGDDIICPECAKQKLM